MKRDAFLSAPKFRYWRSERYRHWVASLPCAACGFQGWSQCAHSNQARHGKGRGIKASDQFTFPLCGPRPGHVGHHTEHDLCIEMTSAERAEIEDEYIARTRAMAPAELRGWPCV